MASMRERRRGERRGKRRRGELGLGFGGGAALLKGELRQVAVRGRRRGSLRHSTEREAGDGKVKEEDGKQNEAVRARPGRPMEVGRAGITQVRLGSG
jgi:hypothetical protein